MFLYTVIEAVVAVIALVYLSLRTKKPEDIVYSKLDKTGVVTNIILLAVYVCLSPLYLFLGMISTPKYDGFLGIIGWILSIIIASAALPCGIGLGLSVDWRKKGKSKQSFIVQFAGLAGIALCVLLYCIFAGNIIRYIN